MYPYCGMLNGDNGRVLCTDMTVTFSIRVKRLPLAMAYRLARWHQRAQSAVVPQCFTRAMGTYQTLTVT